MKMERPKFLIKDLRSENTRPVAEIEKERAELVERAQKELEIIEPSLKELVETIEREKPDMVLFLDKGARVFAGPFRKHLFELMGNNAPRVARYNDDAIKSRFLRGEDISEVASEDFKPLEGKKVFFIDETFSSGKGAVVLDTATRQAGVDMRYFALTREIDGQKDLVDGAHAEAGKFYELSLDEFLKEKTRIQSDPRFTIYPNDIPYLFSKDAASLYVIDEDGKTKSRYELVTGEDVDTAYDYTPRRGELPGARRYDTPPDGMTWGEFDEKTRQLNMQTVRTLTHMIYETLRSDGRKRTHTE
jgi:hypothetical protein